MRQSCLHVLLRTRRKQKKPRVLRVEPKEEVEDECVPAWFQESMAMFETPQEEAMEVDALVNDPSQDPIVEPGNNQSQMMTRHAPKA